jgi:hypothetical protein
VAVTLSLSGVYGFRPGSLPRPVERLFLPRAGVPPLTRAACRHVGEGRVPTFQSRPAAAAQLAQLLPAVIELAAQAGVTTVKGRR